MATEELKEKLGDKFSVYFPNIFYDDDNILISEFKTLEEFRRFPLLNHWTNNLDEANEIFGGSVLLGSNLCIVFNKNVSICDSRKFLLGLTNEEREEYHWFDMNNLEIENEQPK